MIAYEDNLFKHFDDSFRKKFQEFLQNQRTLFSKTHIPVEIQGKDKEFAISFIIAMSMRSNIFTTIRSTEYSPGKSLTHEQIMGSRLNSFFSIASAIDYPQHFLADGDFIEKVEQAYKKISYKDTYLYRTLNSRPLYIRVLCSKKLVCSDELFTYSWFMGEKKALLFNLAPDVCLIFGLTPKDCQRYWMARESYISCIANEQAIKFGDQIYASDISLAIIPFDFIVMNDPQRASYLQSLGAMGVCSIMTPPLL